MSEDAVKVTKEQASQAFSLLVQAVDAALTGSFPVGLDHVEKHMQIKGALQVISVVMKDHYAASEQPKSPELKAVPPEAEPEKKEA
ncbi:MAG: hypothetical protein M5U25_21155 [Planctomycetota bacterium]|nr:hypothetical protein [Planctomycetota bacterium]